MTNAAISVTTSAMITTFGTDPVRPPKMSRNVWLLITISVPTCTRKATPRAMLSMARVATNGEILAYTISRPLMRPQNAQASRVTTTVRRTLCPCRISAGREEIRNGPGRQIALRVDDDALAEAADPPLERDADGVLLALEVQAQDVAHGPADDLLVRQARQLARPAAAADDPALAVADEERGVGRRVVVVEQLEEEPEAALRAPLGLVAEPRGPLGRRAPVAAVRADEQVGHADGLG